LLVGADKSFHTAIAGALARHGVYVETTSAHGVVDAVVATAPDLVLLVGDAASDGGSSVLAHLYATPHSSVVPVAILADDTALDERLRAFRHGAAAVIPRSASVDAIADRVAKLAREIPERDGGTTGYVGEATLDELVQALSRELRSGILSVRSPKGAEDESIRVVLGGGRPLAQTIDEFVSRLRKHVVHAEPLRYEFDERAGGTVQLLGDSADGHIRPADALGLRVLLADDDSVRSDSVAQALRAHQATVVVTDFAPSEARFGRLRQLDPAILLIDEDSLRGPGYALVRRMRGDTRLRWASLLVVKWTEIWSDVEGAARVARTLGTLAALAEPEQSLRERIEVGVPFDTRLEITGPARLLRAAALTKHAVRLTVHNPRIEIRVDISDQLIAGARAFEAGGTLPLEASVALSAMLVLGSGRVRVERLSEANLVNVMSPIDVALNLADSEAPPIAPSLPPSESSRPEALFSLPPPDLLMAPAPPPSRVSPRVLLVVAISAMIGVVLAIFVVAGDAKSEASAEPAAESAPAFVEPNAQPQNKDAARAESVRSGQTAGAVRTPATEAAAAAALPPIKETLTLHHAKTCEEIVGPSFALLVSNQPTRALAETGLGKKALMLGRLDDAQMNFCRAAVLDPFKPEAFLALVRLFLLEGDPVQAREWAERASKQHPGNPDVLALYGDALARTGDPERARALWLETGHIKANDVGSTRLLAYNFVRGGERSIHGSDAAQAERLYRRAAILDPLNASAAAGLGRILLNQSELGAAREWIARAVALEPRDVDLRILHGDVLDKSDKKDAALKEWHMALDLEPRNFKASSRLARAGNR
jgi:DNA-binding NarL/FixJ family response regulator/tetratricopeptide (TPR) repeat protein